MLKRFIQSVRNFLVRPIVANQELLVQLQLRELLEREQRRIRQDMPGNPAGHGYKVYSQADEDGIIDCIVGRLGITNGSCVEFGCGAGVENNTHQLLLKGWRGVWIDGSERNIREITNVVGSGMRDLVVRQAFLDRDNVAPLLLDCVGLLGAPPPVDLMSVDIDGNDLALALRAVGALSPKVLVVEYNSKFRPGTSVCVEYQAGFRWESGDYQGASLTAWVDALADAYTLVACCIAGTNAFFVRRDLASEFPPFSPDILYQPPRYELTALRAGLQPSLEFLRLNLKSRT